MFVDGRVVVVDDGESFRPFSLPVDLEAGVRDVGAVGEEEVWAHRHDVGASGREIGEHLSSADPVGEVLGEQVCVETVDEAGDVDDRGVQLDGGGVRPERAAECTVEFF